MIDQSHEEINLHDAKQNHEPMLSPLPTNPHALEYG